jgi:ribosomal protein L7/L12
MPLRNTAMTRELTEKEYEKITEAIFGGDRIEATTICISMTQCGLTEAQDFVRTVTAELKNSHPTRFVRKKQGKSHWVRSSI